MSVRTRPSKDLLDKINNASDDAQITIFLWFLAVILVACGVICIVMAPPSAVNLMVGGLIVRAGVVVVLARELQQWGTLWYHRCSELVPIQGAVHIIDLPRRATRLPGPEIDVLLRMNNA